MAKKKNKIQVTLAPTTVAFAWFDKPDTGHKFSNNKYKGTFVYDDEDDLAEIEESVQKIAAEEWPDLDLDEVKRPFKTPDEQTKEDFEGKFTLNANSKFKPTAYDAKRKKLPKSVKIFSGDVVAAIVTLLPYESTEKVREGKKTVTVTIHGVTAQLAAVQLVEKRGGGGADPSAFGEYDDGFDASDVEDDDDETDHEGGESVDDDDGDY